jgi:hypothetical protein
MGGAGEECSPRSTHPLLNPPPSRGRKSPPGIRQTPLPRWEGSGEGGLATKHSPSPQSSPIQGEELSSWHPPNSPPLRGGVGVGSRMQASRVGLKPDATTIANVLKHVDPAVLKYVATQRHPSTGCPRSIARPPRGAEPIRAPQWYARQPSRANAAPTPPSPCCRRICNPADQGGITNPASAETHQWGRSPRSSRRVETRRYTHPKRAEAR